jgi:membrane associated rhomboid family serine protease
MRAVQHNKIEIDFCERCGALWLDENEILELLVPESEASKEYHVWLETLGGVSQPTPWRCPRCANAPLKLHPLTRTSGVQVGYCATCDGLLVDSKDLDDARRDLGEAEARRAIDRPLTWQHYLFQFISGLPVEFNVKPRRRPVVTHVLVALNVFIHLTTFLAMNPQLVHESFGMIPARFPSGLWALTLLTSMFLHGGWVHLLGNMYFLWVLGDNVEDVLGRGVYLAGYLLAGAGGDVLSTLTGIAPTIPHIGASGAIAGVMGAYMVFFPRAKLTMMFVIVQLKIPAYGFLGIWVLLNLLGVLLGLFTVDWYAHLGGFFVGLVGALALYRWAVRRNPIIEQLRRKA